MTTYWAENAWLPTGAAAGVRFSVANGRFAQVQPRAKPADGDIRLPGVVLPGFANTHSHAFHRALRGRTHNDGGNFWSWRDQMYAVTRRLNPETYLALARAVFCEMALAGFTVVGEFHYVHHDEAGNEYSDRNAMGKALIRAAREAGVRLTLLDTCYLSGGLSVDGHLPLDDVQRRFTDGDVEGWAARVADLEPDDNTRIGAAVHSVRAVPRDQLAPMAQAAAGKPLHVHLSEQPAENLAAQMYYGRTPTELLDEAGLLGPRTTAVHATHMSDRDIKLLGSSRATACICPTTERDLADGIGPARALYDAGSPLALGSDQHALIDPFSELRGLEMHERLSSGERGRFTPHELVEAATSAGYAALGWEDGGRIAKGALADFIVVRTDSVNTAGARAGQVVYCANQSDIDHVFVGGEEVVHHGRHRIGHVSRLLVESLELVRGRA